MKERSPYEHTFGPPTKPVREYTITVGNSHPERCSDSDLVAIIPVHEVWSVGLSGTPGVVLTNAGESDGDIYSIDCYRCENCDEEFMLSDHENDPHRAWKAALAHLESKR